MSLRLVSFYAFAPLQAAGLEPLRRALLQRGQAAGVRGSVLLAAEGVNGSLSGDAEAVETLLQRLRQELKAAAPAEPAAAGSAGPKPDPLVLTRQEVGGHPFHRLKVRLRREIVTIGLPRLDPRRAAGIPVDAADWNALIGDPDTLVIDTRNGYEVAIGSFEGAIDPGTASFRQFPQWVESALAPLVARRRPRALALFCTGGIRCEKATAYLRQRGFEGVHHLRGGILRYLEQVDPAHSRWRGECFVFDQRVALNQALQPGEHSLCHGCRMPLAPADRARPDYREGVSCRHCAGLRSASDRERFAERQRQVGLARRRGENHFGSASSSPALAAAAAPGPGPGVPAPDHPAPDLSPDLSREFAAAAAAAAPDSPAAG